MDTSFTGRYRSYSNTYGQGAVSFGQLYDASWVVYQQGTSIAISTGAWRPAFPSDFAANISVSGLNLTVGAVAVTGNPQVQISNTPSVTVTNPVYLVGITGQPLYVTGNFGASSSSPGFITGGVIGLTGSPNVTIANASPIPVSGVVQAQVTIGAIAVTGGSISISNPILAVSGNFGSSPSTVGATGTKVDTLIQYAGAAGSPYVMLPIGGRALAVSGAGSLTGSYNTGDYVMFNFNKDNGGLLVNQGTLDYTQDTVTVVISGGTLNVAITGAGGSSSSSQGIITGGYIGITGTPTFTISNPILAVSGALSASINSVAVTGTVYAVDPDSRAILSGISGLLSSNITAPANVTGVITVGNTAPIAISGIVLTVVTGTVSSSITNPIGVTGSRTDFNPFYSGGLNAPYTLLPVGGRAVAVSGAGSVSGYNTGDYAILNFNKDNGGLLVNQGALDSTQDTVTTVLSGSITAPVAAVSGFAQFVLAANPNRLAWGISNLGTGALYVAMGTIPSTGALHWVLKGGVNPNDGIGAVFTDSPCVWRGSVGVSGAFGVPLLYSAWQL